MSIPSSMSSVNTNPGTLKGLAHQRREDFQSLRSAVQSGDMPGVQQDLTKLQADAKAHGAGHHHRHGTGAIDTLLDAIDTTPAGNANANSANVSAMSAYAAMMTAPAATSINAQA